MTDDCPGLQVHVSAITDPHAGNQAADKLSTGPRAGTQKGKSRLDSVPGSVSRPCAGACTPSRCALSPGIGVSKRGRLGHESVAVMT